MWFRYLVTFIDLGFAGILAAFPKKEGKEVKIIVNLLASSLLASAILMWR